MNTETFLSLLRRRPFQPLEIHMSNGDVHLVCHPGMVLLMKSNIFFGSSNSDNFEFLSRQHVVEVKAVPIASGGTNGSDPSV